MIPDWLVASLVLSLVLTVVLNVLLRLSPDGSNALEGRLRRHLQTTPDDHDGPRRVQVYFPWKWMIGLSTLGTIIINLL